MLNPYPATIFCTKMLSDFHICCIYVHVHFRLDIFIDTNNINPDQTDGKEWKSHALAHFIFLHQYLV